MTTAEITIEIMGQEFPAEVAFNYTPAIDGRYSGPPEDCYPSEPEEFDIQSLKIIQQKPVLFEPERKIRVTHDLDDLIPLIESDLIEEIKEWQANNAE